jgi:hypothetical protein
MVTKKIYPKNFGNKLILIYRRGLQIQSNLLKFIEIRRIGQRLIFHNQHCSSEIQYCSSKIQIGHVRIFKP